jgi:hypothetical protein
MNTLVKECWISAKANISCFTDQITILYDVFKVPCQSVSTLTLNFDYYHHVSDEFK